ncbi:phosphorylcholine transferase [Anaerovibrio sp. JC8]|uniref:LicD family protein n=1 Tax=Anaerovibrio sp. JC8 TaxID=1240085 RepID=UPI000A0A4AFA|nr:LicD family protein [Anaerovibrio sp. JC8]ORU01420.1 phosphorylcholine transferase [Anaerovibrio sp. JC8]
MPKLKLMIPKEFYKEEIRDEYLVSTKLKKVWAVELDLLHELLQVCKRHNIKFFAFAGTLLGAIRHKGFIPWDDDMDICMDRENYKKLLHVADEFQEPYFLQTALSDREFFFGYARLRNSESTGLIIGNESPEYNNGIYIDIFVLDGYIEDEKKLHRQLKKRKWLQRFASHYYWEPYHSKGRKIIAHWLLKKMARVLWSYEELIEKFDRNLSKYTHDTDRLALMTHTYDFICKYWCNKADLLAIKWVPFEMLEIPIPANYDSMLKNMYGDYMVFPPVEKRGIWHGGILEFAPDIPYREYMKKFFLKIIFI